MPSTSRTQSPFLFSTHTHLQIIQRSILSQWNMNAKHLKNDLVKGVTAIYKLIIEGNRSLLCIGLHE
jgi:hypothetical protein